MPFNRKAALVGLLLVVITAIPIAPRADDTFNWTRIQAEALDLFTQYLKLDTSNPPGNEISAANFFAAICKREGIEHQVFEPLPGRGTIWARIKGNGSRRPLILLNHMDVVPHDREYWTVDPFSATIKDGMIYGRGAMDMKSFGIAQFMALLTLNRAKVPLSRDIIFLGTADEEAGGLNGAGWFAKNHPELIKGAEFLFNEGGSNVVETGGRVLAVGVGPSEKTPVWLRLKATGVGGHGAIPRPDSTVNRLVRALNRLIDYEPPVRLMPSVEAMFRSLAPLRDESMRGKLLNLRESIKDPEFVKLLDADAGTRSLIRNTISVTMLQGSNKVNVIPPAAQADIDTRVVPGTKMNDWIAELKGVIKDDNITIEPILAFDANASPTNSELVKTIGAFVAQKYPGATISFPVLSGFTDSHFFREMGVHSYGFSPFLAPPRESGGGVHGNDERIGKKAFTDGVRFFVEVVERIAQR